MSEKTKKILSLVMIALALVFAGVVTWYVGRPMVRFVEDPEQFRLWVDAHGIWSRLAFVGMVVFQVLIAVIPGEPIEIGGGYAFGFWEGTLWCVVGIGIGSVIIFALVRRFGVRLVELFFSMEKIRSLKFLQNDRRRDTIAFVIFLLPGTPTLGGDLHGGRQRPQLPKLYHRIGGVCCGGGAEHRWLGTV